MCHKSWTLFSFTFSQFLPFCCCCCCFVWDIMKCLSHLYVYLIILISLNINLWTKVFIHVLYGFIFYLRNLFPCVFECSYAHSFEFVLGIPSSSFHPGVEVLLRFSWGVTWCPWILFLVFLHLFSGKCGNSCWFPSVVRSVLGCTRDSHQCWNGGEESRVASKLSEVELLYCQWGRRGACGGRWLHQPV